MVFENTTKLVAKNVQDGTELEVGLDLNVCILEKAKIESNMNRK